MKKRKFLHAFSDKLFRQKILLCTAIYIVAGILILYIFLDNWVTGLVVTLMFFPVFLNRIRKFIEQKHQNSIETEFYKMLGKISMSLSSGMTLENSLKETIISDRKEYPVINGELERIYRMLQNNYSPEKAFKVFADRSRNREIQAFSEVLNVGLPAGINMAGLIRYLSAAYRMKNDTEQEIKKILNAPKYNNRIILVMPVLCVVLFKGIAPSYFDILYNGTGKIVMLAVLVMLLFAWWLGEKLSDIKY